MFEHGLKKPYSLLKPIFNTLQKHNIQQELNGKNYIKALKIDTMLYYP